MRGAGERARGVGVGGGGGGGGQGGQRCCVLVDMFEGVRVQIFFGHSKALPL
jgi:hypothetical protein